MTYTIEFSGKAFIEANSREEALQKYELGEWDDCESDPDRIYLSDDGGYEE